LLEQTFAPHRINYSICATDIQLQFVGMAFHPKGGTYPEHNHRKLDPKAYFVLELGGAAQYIGAD